MSSLVKKEAVRILTFLIAMGLAMPGFAQVTTGQISGVVKDSSGGVVPNAAVHVVSRETALDRTGATNADGFYAVLDLQPGTYSVRIEHQGFKTVERSGIELTAGDRVDVSPALEVGNVAEVVTVSGRGEQVETDNGTVGRLVDGEQIRELSLNGRNLIQLTMLLPGVVTTTDQFDRGSVAQGNISNFVFNGVRSTSTSLTVDGGGNQDNGGYTAGTANLSVDFVQQVKVASSAYSAEYGRLGGSQINYTTRSGTGQYHGTLFEFFRNDKLNARSFFAPKLEELRLNQFGWNLGGPVLKRGTGKIFFFVGQEYRRRIDGQTQAVTLPTEAQRAGIISTTATLRYPSNFSVVNLRGQPISDPTQGTPANPQGLNILPQQYMTHNGLAIMSIYDAMQKLAVVYTDKAIANNATFELANVDIRREDIARVDYQPSERNQFYVRYLYDVGTSLSPYFEGPMPNFQNYRDNQSPNAQLAWTAVISGKTINEAAVASNYLNLWRPIYGTQGLPQTYGLNFKELYSNLDQVYGIPSVAIAGYTSLSQSINQANSPMWEFSARDNFTRVEGKHILKVGILAMRDRKNQNFTFNTGGINFNPSGNIYSTGNAILDTLLGNYYSYTETNKGKWTFVRATQIESYVADTWKVKSNLTLDIGLRYSFMEAPYVTDNTISTFLPSLYNPANAQRVIPTGTNVGQLQPGVGQPYNGIAVPGSSFYNSSQAPTDPAAQNLFHDLPRGFYNNQNKFSPRFGFAYDPFHNGTFSIRGGAAIYYDQMNLGDTTAVGYGNPPFVTTATLYNGQLDNLAASQNVPFPVSDVGTRLNVQSPTTYNWSFGFQRKLPFQTLLDVNYVSTQGRHLERRPNINQVTPAVQYANSAINLNALRPYQGYTNITLYETSASSSYNALQVALSRRYSKKLTYT